MNDRVIQKSSHQTAKETDYSGIVYVLMVEYYFPNSILSKYLLIFFGGIHSHVSLV